MENSFSIYIIIFFLLSISCNKQNKHEIHSKYSIERKMKGVNFKVFLISENKNDSTLDIAMKISAIDNSNILNYGIQNENAYLQRIYYFSYQVENDLWIEQNNTIIPCSGAVFERNYNLTKDITLNLHFDNVSINKNKILVYYPQPFDLVPLKFKLK
jgi:hypothetical protein